MTGRVADRDRATCDFEAEAFDVNNGPHLRRCDQPAGHDGEHHPAIVVEG